LYQISKGSISKKKNPTPEKGIRKNEKEEEEEEEYYDHEIKEDEVCRCVAREEMKKHTKFIRKKLKLLGKLTDLDRMILICIL
jgi:hypothetical protein